MLNVPLFLVSVVFFLGASAIFYGAAWLLVSLAFRLLLGLPAYRKKNLLFAALVVPPVTLGVLAVGGVTLHHVHAPAILHHNDLCRTMYEFLAPPSQHIHMGSLGFAINGFAWLLLAWGIGSIVRLVWATAGLQRDLSPFLQPASPKLASVVARVQAHYERQGKNSPRFFEANIPMAYSCLLGFWHPYCLLSTELAASSSETELEAVVAHEISHLRAGDVWFTLVVSVLNCLFFFLQPVRLLSRRWREEAELSCDVAAVSTTGEPLALAAAILRAQGVPVLVQQPMPTIALAFAEEAACATEKRVERLIAYAKHSTPPAMTPRANLWQWTVTALLTGIGLMALMTPQMLCAAHCSLEAIARMLH